MTENNDNIRPEFEIIEKIKILNIRKGDVLIVKYKAEPPIPMPRETWTKLLRKQIQDLKAFVKENWGGRVGLISIPDTIDIEVMRLEEWFV